MKNFNLDAILEAMLKASERDVLLREIALVFVTFHYRLQRAASRLSWAIEGMAAAFLLRVLLSTGFSDP